MLTRLVTLHSDLARFGKVVKLTGFRPFTSAVDALTQCNAVSEGVLTEELVAFLSQALPSAKKGKSFVLGVSEAKLGASILERTSIRCECNDRVLEALRGVRTHYERMVSGLKEGDAGRAALGLAHAYSRGKVKFNVNKVDNMIIQAIALLDQMDKDVNTFAMRVRCVTKSSGNEIECSVIRMKSNSVMFEVNLVGIFC